jgi:hypothetical protein
MTDSQAQMKTCRKCGREKPVVEFRRNHITADGFLPDCNACMSVAQAAGHQRRREVLAGRRTSTMAPPAALESLSAGERKDMFMLLVYGCNGYIESMKECYSQNEAAFEAQQERILTAFDRLCLLLPPEPGGTIAGDKTREDTADHPPTPVTQAS